MKTLSTELRRQLERTVVDARDVAEAGARSALEALAVHHHEPYGHMSSEPAHAAQSLAGARATPGRWRRCTVWCSHD